jgi:bifunctional UDP-N-acetylglucosamine pyrophosphorylase/glucosamine-1-phosphate N-acetyltransferase
VEVKNSILMDRAATPHLSYVGDSVIGERSNLGAGTITANVRHDGKNVMSAVKGAQVDSGRRKLGAIIGDDVHTGINTSIYPGRKLWPNTSTYPGEVVRRDIADVKRLPPKA